MGDGRPTLFRGEYTQKLIEFFNKPAYVEKIRKKYYKDGSVEEIPYEVPADFPTLAGFAVEIGVSKQTLWEWATAKNQDGTLKYEGFSYAYEQAKSFQEKILVMNALSSRYNGTFAQFVAKNLIDYKDKTEQDTSLSGNIDIKIASDEEDL